MKKPFLCATLLALSLSVFAPGASAQSVAIMGANDSPWNEEVRSKIEATGFFDTVDAVDLYTVTPTLEELEGYCAVLAYTDSDPANSVALGDNLADYVDAGGGVVAAVFATASAPWEGRFNDENYWAIQPTSQQQNTEAFLGTIFLPGHPILEGVSSFDGGTSSYRPSADSLHPEAVRVANWTGDDNIPLIATRFINDVPRVDLGFYPPSTDSRDDFWVASTDGARIMANALLYVCNSYDLAISKSATPNPVEAGSDLTYTIEISNAGPSTAANVVMTDILPTGVDFVSVSPAAACSQAAGTLTCSLGDLEKDTSASVTVVVIPQTEGLITNEASVTAEGTDVNPENNSATVTTTILAAPLVPAALTGGGCSLDNGSKMANFGVLGMSVAILAMGLIRRRAH